MDLQSAAAVSSGYPTAGNGHLRESAPAGSSSPHLERLRPTATDLRAPLPFGASSGTTPLVRPGGRCWTETADYTSLSVRWRRALRAPLTQAPRRFVGSMIGRLTYQDLRRNLAEASSAPKRPLIPVVRPSRTATCGIPRPLRPAEGPCRCRDGARSSCRRSPAGQRRCSA
jgi:hypothetical protein